MLILILILFFFNNDNTHQERKARSPAGQWEHRYMESGPAIGNEEY